MNFIEIINQCGRFIQDTSSGRQLRIKDSINRRYNELAIGNDWPDLLRFQEAEVTASGGDKFVYLPKYVDVVKKIYDDTNRDILKNFSPEIFLNRNFDRLTTTGQAIEFTLVGSSAVKRDITTAEKITLVSSGVGDTSLDVEIWGLVSGEEINETLTTNSSDGTIAVTSTNTFSRITKIGTKHSSIAGDRVGILTIKGLTSSIEYATIAPQDVESRYQVFRLHPLPSADSTLTIIYKKHVIPLLNNGDTLEIPVGPALVELVIADILRQQRKWAPANQHELRGQSMILDYMSRYSMQSESVQQGVPAIPGRRQDRKITVIGS